MTDCRVRRVGFASTFCLLTLIFFKAFFNEPYCIDMANGVPLVVVALVCGEILKYHII